MVKVAGIWEVGWNTPMLEHDLWIYPIEEFQVDAWYMCPVSGIAKSSFIKERADLQQVLDENPDMTVVWVEEFGETTLQEFVHPPNALYITGKTGLSPMNTALSKEGDLSVRIETIVNGGGLWSHQAMTMVLYDRMQKLK